MTIQKEAISFVLVLFAFFMIGCSKEDSKRETGFRPLPSQSSPNAERKMQFRNSDESDNRLEKIEQWLKKANYKLVNMTFAGPFLTSKPYSQEVDEIADFWLCYKTISLLKALLTTSIADNGKFIELQFPIELKDDALKLAKYLDGGLFNEATKLLSQSEGKGEVTIAGGYSVSLSTDCPTASDKRGIVIRSVRGPHEFHFESYQTMRAITLDVYKVQHKEDQK